jgi:hypothetical protein
LFAARNNALRYECQHDAVRYVCQAEF